jgi:hypothetical protein
MMLTNIKPSVLGFDFRTLKCDACDHTEKSPWKRTQIDGGLADCGARDRQRATSAVQVVSKFFNTSAPRRGVTWESQPWFAGSALIAQPSDQVTRVPTTGCSQLRKSVPMSKKQPSGLTGEPRQNTVENRPLHSSQNLGADATRAKIIRSVVG